MNYATQADMTLRFGVDEMVQRTDPTGAGVIDAALMAIALADASAEIDSYLIGQYAVPLTVVPTEVVRLCCDIARYRLWDVAASEAVKVRYDDAIKKLRDVAKGVASLGLAASGASPVAALGGSVQISSAGRDFGRAGRTVW